MHALSQMYLDGEVVQKDDGFSLYLLETSAKKGFPYAHNELGIRYGRGLSVKRNLEKSYMWFNVAASQGVERAIKAVEKFDELAIKEGHLTKVQMDNAKIDADICIQSKYVNCSYVID